MKEGSPIAFFDFRGMEPPPEFDPHPALSIAIDEAEAPAIKTVPFEDALGAICACVETDILDRFRPFF